MAITAQFRPAQGVYQSTYEPFPFQSVAPIAMQMYQEEMSGMAKQADTEAGVEALAVGSSAKDQATAANKKEELRSQLQSITEGGISARSPEFNLALNKVVSGVKKDPFWKLATANAAKEAEWQKAIASDAPLANKWSAIKQYADYLDKGSEEYGKLGNVQITEYVDYQARMDKSVEGILGTGWKTSIETNEFERSGGATGVDPARVANILGLEVKNNKLSLVGIPKWFYDGEAGNQLKQEAELRYDQLKVQDPETEYTIEDVENQLYIETAAPLVGKESGFVTEEAEGVVTDKDRYAGLDFFSYIDEVASQANTPQAKKALAAYKRSGMVDIYGIIAELPGWGMVTDKAMEMVDNLRGEAKSEEEVLAAIEYMKTELGATIGSMPINAGMSIGPAMGTRISGMLLAPIEYARTETAPDNLTESETNFLNKLIAENPNLEKEIANNDGRITDRIWKEMGKKATGFYDTAVRVDVGINLDEIKNISSYIKQTTGVLFGIPAASGMVETASKSDGTLPGRISQLVIIDKETGETTSVKEMDLPADEKIPVEFKGVLSPDNPWGPQTLSVHINGKDYYALGHNPDETQMMVNSLNSYKFSHDGYGLEFAWPSMPEVKMTPHYEYGAENPFKLTVDGEVYESSESMDDAYWKFLQSE